MADYIGNTTKQDFENGLNELKSIIESTGVTTEFMDSVSSEAITTENDDQKLKVEIYDQIYVNATYKEKDEFYKLFQEKNQIIMLDFDKYSFEDGKLVINENIFDSEEDDYDLYYMVLNSSRKSVFDMVSIYDDHKVMIEDKRALAKSSHNTIGFKIIYDEKDNVMLVHIMFCKIPDMDIIEGIDEYDIFEEVLKDYIEKKDWIMYENIYD